MKFLTLAVLALFFIFHLGAEVPEPSISPAPGTFPGPITVQITAEPGSSVSYRFLESSGAQTFPWGDPLVLGAMDGETRVYTLRVTMALATGESVTKDFRYKIQCSPQPGPSVLPPPGPYSTAVAVKPTLPPGWLLTQDGKTLASPPTLDVNPGENRTFPLVARGPHGESFEWTYFVDRRDQELESLEVVSPSQGIWANSQPLVAVFRGVDRVLWSWGARLDFKAAFSYHGPVPLDKSGVQTITIGAHSRSTGKWLEKTITWTNGQEDVPVEGWPLSGVSGQTVVFPEAAGWELSWDNGRSWQPSLAEHREEMSSVSRKVLSVAVRKSGKTLKYVYWMDPRPPLSPTLQFFGGWNPVVTFSGSMESLHQVTWTKADGNQMVEPEGLWGPIGSWKVPDGVVAARVSAVGLNGLAGESSLVGFAETGWSTPEWEPWGLAGPLTDHRDLPLGGKLLPRPGFTPVYEITDKPEVREPDSRSPWLSGAFLPTVPLGADRTFYARFAWRDAGGLTGPSSPVISLRVNRIPPGPPEVFLSGGNVLVKAAEGEDAGTSLFWAVTQERVAKSDGIAFQPYGHPLDISVLQAGTPGNLWFHAQVVDRYGNTGIARLNVALTAPGLSPASSLVQVDPDPLVGESAVEDGGIYPWGQFRLRALGAAQDLWVGVSDSGTGVPNDWKTQVQPWVGLVTRSVGKGGRNTFVLYWNSKTEKGWAWAEPKHLSLTLEQGPPAPLKNPVEWPSGLRKDPWTLEVFPGQPGDTLKYTYTLDGSTPPDPQEAGEVWKGSRTWEAPPGGKVSVRVRMAAVSVAGLSVELPDCGPVVIDRTPPPTVIPPLPPFTFWSGPMTVALPPSTGLVRYKLTSDGSVPGIPGEQDENIPSTGLLLPGVQGKSTLYRFRWRSFSPAGIPGNVSETYAVLVERSATSGPVPGNAAGIPATPLPIPGPHITGLPVSGVSAEPVTLDADWPLGTLRFELREGAGNPPPVTWQSPLWDKTLILDGGAGVDRTFAVSLRGFSPDGQPLTPESRYTVRIDRAIPGAPSVDLVSDDRRPAAQLKISGPTQNSEETLLFRWFWETYPGGTGQSEWVPLEPANSVFNAPGGALTRVRVQACYRDEAGNEGPVSEAAVLIDQNVVYLGTGLAGNGTREKPTNSVGDALELARRTGKSILMVASGTYDLPQTANVGGFQIYGGLNPDLWDRTSQPTRSLWKAMPPFKGASLLESGNKAWTLAGVDLSTGGVGLDQVVFVDGADVRVKNSNWVWNSVMKGWGQTGGKLELTGVTAQYEAKPQGIFLGLKDTETSVKGFEIAATQNNGGKLVSLVDCQSLFQDIVVVSKKSADFDGIWTSTGGRLTVDNARIMAGEGASRATAFAMKNTDATFWNTEIDLFGSASNTIFQTSGGRLELQKSALNLVSGQEFNQGFVVDHGNTVLTNVDLKIGSGAYQGGFDLTGGSLTMETCTVRLAGGGQQAWGARFPETCRVKLTDVSWELDSKTAGDLWVIQKPWGPGSVVTGSQTPGW